jgi:hypothetical protein
MRCSLAVLALMLAATAARRAAGQAPREVAAATMGHTRALTPALMDYRVLSVGAGYTSGWAGVEWAQRAFFGRPVMAPVVLVTAVGAGVAGVGSRLLVEYQSLKPDAFWAPYVGTGFAYTPWRRGSSGAWGGEVGVQHWGQDGGWFLDAGVGAARVTGGRWFGRRTTPVVRLAAGRGLTW